MGGNEIKYVNQAFATNWIAPLGPNVDGFENELANYLKSSYVAALSSGTAALHLALIMLDIKVGDEVICQSFTFSASANPIVYQGATPVFIDSEKDTWNMDPNLLEEAIKDRIAKGKKPKAIIIVHLYGMPAKMDELFEIANRYEIPIIEDAAEALGSKYKGKSCGTFGLMSILSFNGNKIITTSGGGALVSESKELIERSRFLATQARDNAPHYQHSQIGYNYRMSNIVAGIGRGQLEVIEERIEKKRNINKFYHKILDKKPGVSFLEEPNVNFFSNHWLSSIIVDPKQTGGIGREDIRLAMATENIECRPLWKPMHLQPIFVDAPAYVNGTSEALFEQGLCLASDSKMNEENKKRISDTFIKIFNGLF
jgi:dTDP-4-amino-4,6-dideoxygalactose transaminase